MTAETLKTPAHSVEAEQSVIGGLLIDPDRYHDVAALVGEADFYRNDHRLIYRALSNICEDGGQCDMVTVAELLDVQGDLERIGGLPYLLNLAENTPGSANILAYADIVRTKSVFRQATKILSNAVGRTLDPQGSTPADIIAEVQIQLEGLQAARKAEALSWGDVLSAGRKRMEAAAEARANGGHIGVATGLPKLDHWMGGMRTAGS